MKRRTELVGIRIRPHEHALLAEEAGKRDLGSISNLVRVALDEFLGTNMAEGDLSFIEDRPKRPCKQCFQRTTHLYGEEQFCGRCYRQAHPEKFANAGGRAEKEAGQ
jgi:hypothetical protein